MVRSQQEEVDALSDLITTLQGQIARNRHEEYPDRTAFNAKLKILVTTAISNFEAGMKPNRAIRAAVDDFEITCQYEQNLADRSVLDRNDPFCTR